MNKPIDELNVGMNQKIQLVKIFDELNLMESTMNENKSVMVSKK